MRNDSDNPVNDLDTRYEVLSRYTLSPNAPADVAIKFEHAKNLYLYAWFGPRFHVLAQQHALTTLELALRSSLERGGLVPGDRNPKPGLEELLSIAKERGLIERPPQRRDTDACGASNLRHAALGTFEEVKEIVNQLYPQEMDARRSCASSPGRSP